MKPVDRITRLESYNPEGTPRSILYCLTYIESLGAYHIELGLAQDRILPTQYQDCKGNQYHVKFLNDPKESLFQRAYAIITTVRGNDGEDSGNAGSFA